MWKNELIGVLQDILAVLVAIFFSVVGFIFVLWKPPGMPFMMHGGIVINSMIEKITRR